MDRHGGSDDERLDALIREALEPDPRRVRAMVAVALAPARRRAQRLAWAAAAAGLLAVAGALALAPWHRQQPPSPAPSQAIVISNKGGVLTVTTPSGCEWVSVTRADAGGGS